MPPPQAVEKSQRAGARQIALEQGRFVQTALCQQLFAQDARQQAGLTSRRQPAIVDQERDVSEAAFGQFTIRVPQQQVEGLGRLAARQRVIAFAPRGLVLDELGRGAQAVDGLFSQGQLQRCGCRRQRLDA